MFGDPAANIIFGGTDKVTPVIRKVGAEVKGFQKTIGGVGSSIPIFDKLAAATGGLLTPTTLAIGGAVALGGVLIDSAKAASEEQINIAKLGASLRANIPNWDGNTKAIEATISARERLAFSDDDLRDSLALLVGATHDVGKALEIQRTAMDLARLKGISLKDASTALVRVEGGQYRALKSLGIVLKEGATATDALAAVQRVAAGQAEAYGNTIVGKTEAMEIKFHDLQETLGRFTLPLLDQLTTKALDGADALDKLTGSTEGTDMAIDGAGKVVADFIASGGNIAVLAQSMATETSKIRGQFEATKNAAQKNTRDLTRIYDGAQGEMRGATRAFYKPVWHEFDVAAFKAQQAAAELPGQMADSILSGQDDLESAMDDLTDIIKNPPDPRTHALGVLWSKDLAKGLASQNPYVRAKAEALRLAALRELAAHYFFTAGVNAGRSFSRGLPTSTGGNRNPNVRAKGGPVTKGVAYIVGEHQPEVFVPNQNGKILPDVKTLPEMGSSPTGASSAASTSITVNVNTSGVMTPATARSLSDEIGPAIYDYLYRRGAVGRVA